VKKEKVVKIVFWLCLGVLLLAQCAGLFLTYALGMNFKKENWDGRELFDRIYNVILAVWFITAYLSQKYDYINKTDVVEEKLKKKEKIMEYVEIMILMTLTVLIFFEKRMVIYLGKDYITLILVFYIIIGFIQTQIYNKIFYCNCREIVEMQLYPVIGIFIGFYYRKKHGFEKGKIFNYAEKEYKEIIKETK